MEGPSTASRGNRRENDERENDVRENDERENDERENDERENDERENGGESQKSRAQRLLAELPARFKPSSSRPVGEAGSSQGEADPRVVAVVRKWLELKESRGVVITQDLRKRHWYKSPDMMMSMLRKFGINDRGTLFQVDMRGLSTGSEMRALWSAHEVRRREERGRERKREIREIREGDVAAGAQKPKIAFTGSKKAAVQAAVQAARAHAAERDDGKRQKR